MSQNETHSEDEDSEPYMLLPDVSSDEMHLVIEGSENEEVKQINEKVTNGSADMNVIPSSQCCLLV